MNLEDNKEETSNKQKELNDKELNENFKNIEKEIASKKEVPKSVLNKINQSVFENILIADIIMIFLYFVSLGSLTIDSDAFITDLKVFSILLIVLTIILFEYSYKKDSSKICIHGIECLVLAIFTLFSTSLYSFYFRNFDFIISMISIIVGIYYSIKSIIIYKSTRKKYFEGLNDINEIIKK